MPQEVEGRYRPNPYHNAMHAADVTQSAVCMLEFDNLSEHMSDLELLCIIIACCIHDVGHYGVNNDFLVKTQHEWALIYNDTSVNENMHVRIAFEILQEPHCNIFESALSTLPPLACLSMPLVTPHNCPPCKRLVSHCSIQCAVPRFPTTQRFRQAGKGPCMNRREQAVDPLRVETNKSGQTPCNVHPAFFTFLGAFAPEAPFVSGPRRCDI